MTDYHADATCGACDGPLECDRDALCRKCCPEDGDVTRHCPLCADLVARLRKLTVALQQEVGFTIGSHFPELTAPCPECGGTEMVPLGTGINGLCTCPRCGAKEDDDD